MKVIWKTGYRAPVSAKVAYDVICDLHSQGKGTAKDLVDVSRPEDAPLHCMFEWNDSIAAEKYREDQGRCIIRHIVEVPETEEEKATHPPVIRAVFQIDDDSSRYEPTFVIMSDSEKRERLLDIAKRELLQFKAKYESLQELAKVFEAINKVCNQD